MNNSRTLAIGLFAFVWFLTSCSPGGPREAQPNVLLVVVDTLAASHLGLYSNELDTSPNIDQLGQQGVVFEQAYSATPWTMPAVASIFTSEYPASHGVLRFDDSIEPSMAKIATSLKSVGYQTAGFVANVLLTEGRGFATDFDNWKVIKEQGPSSGRVTIEATAWLNNRDDATPFFLYLHYMDPHYPYEHHPQHDRTSGYGPGRVEHPGEMITMFANGDPIPEQDLAHMVDLYREEIAFTDQQVGRVLSHLETLQLNQDTIVVFVADHGEEFLEHGGFEHGKTLYQELVRVPLILRVPGSQPGLRIDAPVSILDIAPTILELVGNVSPFGAGASLVGHVFQEQPIKDRELFGETIWGEEIPILQDLPQPSNAKLSTDEAGWLPKGDPLPSRAALKTYLVAQGFKIIHDQINDWWELYDLNADPEETINLFGGHPSEQELRRKLEAWETESGATASTRLLPPEPLELDQEEVEQLRSLGYL